MIKIIEQGQKTFTRTCDRCGCKFSYELEDLVGMDSIYCPCCSKCLIHIGPGTQKIDLEKLDTHTITFPSNQKYNYATTTGGQYIDPNTSTTTAFAKHGPTSDSIEGRPDPNIKTYSLRHSLPDDVVAPFYHDKVSSDLPDDILDTYFSESQSYKDWHDTKIDKN